MEKARSINSLSIKLMQIKTINALKACGIHACNTSKYTVLYNKNNNKIVKIIKIILNFLFINANESSIINA
jgi:hypothetical protein